VFASFFASLIALLPGALCAQQQCCEDADCPAGVKWGAVGKTTQRTYCFFYQSGHAPDRYVYRLRNDPGSVLTTVKWMDGSQPLVEWDLARQSDKNWAACPVHVWSDPPRQGKTRLSYGGPNRDECSEEVAALVPPRQKAGIWPFVSVTLKGNVANPDEPDGKPIYIDVTFSSSVGRKERPFTIDYTISVGKESASVVCVRAPLQELPDVLCVSWLPALQKPLVRQFDRRHYSAGQEGSLNTEAESVELRSGRFALCKAKRVLAAIQGEFYAPQGLKLDATGKRR
jgi:hypothetical protein